MPRLKLYTLGPPRVELNNEPVEFSRRKALALLIYLAVTRQPHSRDALATLFYPDSDQSQARAYLRRDLAVINTSLNGHWLDADRDVAQLKEGYWLDVVRFEEALAACRAHDHPPEVVCRKCVELLDEASALYTDDFLAGFTLRDCPEFDDWQFFQAEGLRQELATVLERLVQGCSGQGDYKSAIPHARRWLALDPLHEPAQRALIQLYDQAGQPSAALRQYEEFVDLLEEELGLPPQEETRTLYEAIRAKRMLGPYLKRAEAQRSQEVKRASGSEPPPVEPPPPQPKEKELVDSGQARPKPALAEAFTVTPPPPDAGHLHFVAREQELALLNSWLEAAMNGQHRVVFITGEAGQGKTTLLRAFAQEAQDAHAAVIVAGGNCNAYTGQGDPYLPFREILETLTGDVEARAVTGLHRNEHVERLRQILPVTVQAILESGPNLLNTFVPAKGLLERAGAAVPAGTGWLSQLRQLITAQDEALTESGGRQQSLFEEFARVVQTLARQWPLLLVLDDLQWADQGSTNLLFHLGRRLRGHRVLIVGAYRPADLATDTPAPGPGYGAGPESSQTDRHPLDKLVNEFQREFGDIVLDLAQSEGRAFVDALLDSEPNRFDRDFRETLFRQTGGHPLFTTELMRGLQERGDLTRDEAGYWQVSARLEWSNLPARIEGIIKERIARLPAGLQELLKIGSVEGETFTAEVAARVQGLDERQLVRQMSGILDRQHRLIRSEGSHQLGGRRVSRYRFRHILFQEFLYHGLDDVERAYLHEAVGQELEQIHAQDIDTVAPPLARHFEQAGLIAKTVDYLVLAGDRARRLFALPQAIRYYARAIRFSETHPHDVAAEIHVKLHERQGEAQAQAGDFVEAVANLQRVLMAAQQAGDQAWERDLRTKLGMVYRRTDDYVKAKEQLSQAITLSRTLDDTRSVADALFHLGTVVWSQGLNDQALAYYQEAATLCESLGLKDRIATQAFHGLGEANWMAGNLAEARRYFTKSLDLARQLGDKSYEAENLYMLGLADSGHSGAEYEQALVHLKAAEEICRSARLDWHLMPTLLIAAEVYAGLGDYEHGLTQLVEGIEVAEQLNNMRFLSIAYDYLGYLLQEFNLIEEASAAHHQSLRLAQVVDTGMWSPRTQANLAIDRMWLGEQDSDVRHQLEAALETAMGRGQKLQATRALEGLAELALKRENVDQALVYAGQLLALAEAKGIPESTARAYRWQGEALLASGADQAAEAALQAAVQTADKLGRPSLVKAHHQALANFYRVRGRPAEAEAHQTIADRTAEHQAEQLARSESQINELRAHLATAQLPDIHHAELPLPAPGWPETGDAPSSHMPDLPRQSIPFIGRQRELAEISRLLRDETQGRLVTVVGPGGIGKTRLALQAAVAVTDSFQHGVYFVPLAPLDSVETMIPVVAENIGYRFHGSQDPGQQLLDHLQDKQLLLIMDNFEHLLPGTALLANMLQAAPQVKILATSRERLNMMGETIFQLGGMEAPDRTQARDTLEFDAARLLLQQARLVRQTLELTDADRAQIIRICRLTQGMPLALVLAASWLELLSLQEIADEIEQRLDFLETELLDLPERQRSMRAVFESSWNRLSEEERQSFMSLTVFRGGFSRGAAQTITGTGLRTLRTLVNKSFVTLHHPERYEIHELLRQYGETQLVAAGLASGVRQAHATHFLNALHQQEADLTGPRQIAILDDIEANIENIRAAWNWAVRKDKPELIERALESLYTFYYTRSRFQEGQDAFNRAVERFQALDKTAHPTTGLLLVKLLARQGAFCHALGLYQQATRLLEQSLALAQELGSQTDVAFALRFLGDLDFARGKISEAQHHYQHSLELCQKIDDLLGQAYALEKLGFASTHLNEYRQAKQYHLQSLALLKQANHQAGIAQSLDKLGINAWYAGEFDESEKFYRESLAICKGLGDQLGMAKVLGGLGLVTWAQGESNIEAAQAYLTDSLALCRETGHRLEIANRLLMLGWLAISQKQYARAQQYNEEGLRISEKIGYKHGMTIGLNGLGEAACGQGEFETARQQLFRALEIAVDSHRVDNALNVMANLACVFAKTEQPSSNLAGKELAVEILTLVSRHPATWQVIRHKAARWLAEFSLALPAAARTAAETAGQRLSFDGALARLRALQSTPAPPANSPADDTLGQRFIEQHLLARGGMGDVYLGRDTATGQPVAIKRLRPELISSSPHTIQRLIREAEALRKLNHPNIVKILDTMDRDGQPVIIMEYVPGGSLQELLKKQRRLSLDHALSIGLELADALARVHHLGILHRDLKPGNVLLAADGTPRLTDFGVAYLADHNTRLTREGTILGTSAYLSPEAWRGELLDERSEVWSLGAVLYEMLTGRPPFDGEQIVTIMTRIVHDPLPDLAQIRPELPAALVALLEHMLVKDRRQRLDSMRQVAARLEAIKRNL